MSVPIEEQELLNRSAMNDSLGVKLSDKYDDFAKTRIAIEKQWLKNYRQYKGIYDPEIESTIPKNFSKAYPKITRIKVRALLARMMEMLFPSSDKNWTLNPTPIPDVPQIELQNIINTLQQALEQQYQQQLQAVQQAQTQGQQLPPPSEPVLDDEMIEDAIREWAKQRAMNMSELIEDQLKEFDYEQMVKKVVKSALMYGLGVLKGPMAKPVKKRTWKQSQDGKFEAIVEDSMVPYYELVRVWDFFPDYSVAEFEYSDGFFEQHIMSRHDMFQLTKRPDFYKEVIEQYLADHQMGNYSRPSYEQELKDTEESSTDSNTSRLYMAKEFTGFVERDKMVSMGVNLRPGSEKEVLANIWLLDNKIIKAQALPFDSPMEYYHTFVLDEEGSESTPVGGSLPEDIRDSQMGVCASTRMLLDNASVSTGMQLEINTDLLRPGTDTADVHAFKKWYREGTGSEASAPAIRVIRNESHTNELLSIINLFREFADEESMLPKWAVGGGASPGGEALRTSGATSMLLGASNMTVKDIVRQFDKFTVSVMTSHYRWNMLYSTREDVKGDFTVVAKGAVSLVAKEIRANAMDQMIATLTPEERAEVDPRKTVIERLKVRDIEPEDVLYSEEESAQNKEREFELRKQQADSDRALVDARTKKLLTAAAKEVADMLGKGKRSDAEIAEIVSRTERNLALADKDGTSTGIAFVQALKDELQQQVEQPRQTGQQEL